MSVSSNLEKILSKQTIEFIKGREARRATVRKIRSKAQAAIVNKKELVQELIIEAINKKFQSEDGEIQFQQSLSQYFSLPNSFENCLLDGNVTTEKMKSILEENSQNPEYAIKIMQWLNNYKDPRAHAVSDTDKTESNNQSNVNDVPAHLSVENACNSTSMVYGLKNSLTSISDQSPKEETPTDLYLGGNSTSLSELPLGSSFNSVLELSFLFPSDDNYEDPASVSPTRSNLTSASILSMGSSLTSISELSHLPPKEENPADLFPGSNSTSLSELPLGSRFNSVLELSFLFPSDEDPASVSPTRSNLISASILSLGSSLTSISELSHLPPKEENPADSCPGSNSVPELSFLPSNDNYEDPADLLSPRSNLTSASILSLGSSLTSVSEFYFWNSSTSLSELSYCSFQKEEKLANSLPGSDFVSVLNLSFSPSWDGQTTISQQPSSHEIRGSLGDVRMPVMYSPPDEDQIMLNEYTKEEKDTNLAQMKVTSSSLPDLSEKQLLHLESSASCRSSGYSSLHSFPMESLKSTPPSTHKSSSSEAQCHIDPSVEPSNDELISLADPRNEENHIPIITDAVGDEKKRKKKRNRLKRFCAALKSVFRGCIFR